MQSNRLSFARGLNYCIYCQLCDSSCIYITQKINQILTFLKIFLKNLTVNRNIYVGRDRCAHGIHVSKHIISVIIPGRPVKGRPSILKRPTFSGRPVRNVGRNCRLPLVGAVQVPTELGLVLLGHEDRGRHTLGRHKTRKRRRGLGLDGHKNLLYFNSVYIAIIP